MKHYKCKCGLETRLDEVHNRSYHALPVCPWYQRVVAETHGKPAGLVSEESLDDAERQSHN